MTVKLISHTPDPERTVAAAARLCYSRSGATELLDNMSDQKVESFVTMLSEIGHESPIEHVSFTFAIEGVSRSMLAQITRHRIASYSVQSQRYVKIRDMEFVTPPEISACPEADGLYREAMRSAGEYYSRISAILQDRHERNLRESGLDEKEARLRAEKAAIEDARFVLPNACETKMVVTMNARSLMNFFRHRCCGRAQWEIRAVADEMLRLVRDVAPTLFAAAGPPCVSGPCPEGAKSCGRAAEMRGKYKTSGGV